MNLKDNLNIEVQISEDVHRKVLHWVNKAGTREISGFGNVVFDQDNQVMRVTEAYLLDQENAAASSDIDPEALGKLMFEHHKSGVEGELKWWWHSHVQMPVFWSGTDLTTIGELGEGGWILSTVFNQKDEMRSSLYMQKPIKFFADELPTVIESETNNEAILAAVEELGYKVKKEKLDEFLWSIEKIVPDELLDSWDEEFEDKVRTFRYESSAVNVITCSRYMPAKISLPKQEEEEDDGPVVKEPFPDYDPKGDVVISLLDSELIEELTTVLHSWPHISKQELIEMYEDDHDDIEEIVEQLMKERPA